MDRVTKIKAYFNDKYRDAYKEKVSVYDMISKNDRAMIMPDYITNTYWLLCSKFVPPNLQQRAEKIGKGNDCSPYVNHVADVIDMAQDAEAAEIVGYAVTDTPVAILKAESDCTTAVNAKYLLFFQKVGAVKFFINKRTCLCMTKEKKIVGVIMSINYPDL